MCIRDRAYTTVLSVYLPIAIIGYQVYGTAVFSPILCSIPRTGVIQMGAKALVTLHILLTYPVLMSLLLTGVERAVKMSGSSGPVYLVKRTIFRCVLVGATIGVAVAVPYFSTIMSLVGALCVVACTFVLPALFFVKLHTTCLRDRLLPLGVALVGTVGATIGAEQAFHELVDKIRTHASE
eukprot:TRINITY_DN37402_c0_g1_i1.p2 TRINITY_DN37402_c0_g1~~TRINITY_DN37402_c0_g1_i1.p2  ORF type:complete len:181 (+),score=24.62 TRINITY_DN37402_c0_g1_i1:188-730(+)